MRIRHYHIDRCRCRLFACIRHYNVNIWCRARFFCHIHINRCRCHLSLRSRHYHVDRCRCHLSLCIRQCNVDRCRCYLSLRVRHSHVNRCRCYLFLCVRHMHMNRRRCSLFLSRRHMHVNGRRQLLLRCRQMHVNFRQFFSCLRHHNVDVGHFCLGYHNVDVGGFRFGYHNVDRRRFGFSFRRFRCKSRIRPFQLQHKIKPKHHQSNSSDYQDILIQSFYNGESVTFPLLHESSLTEEIFTSNRRRTRYKQKCGENSKIADTRSHRPFHAVFSRANRVRD